MTKERRIHKVLLVEDDASIQILVTHALEQIGTVVVGVTGGGEAIPRSLDVQPDLVLLDIALPGMNGWDILAELRSLEETAHIPVIIITAHGQSGWQAKALRLGADLFVEKPFRVGMLVREVASMLENGRRDVDIGDGRNR